MAETIVVKVGTSTLTLGGVNTYDGTFTITAGTNNTKSPMRCVNLDASGRPRTSVDTNHVDADGCN
mgnify:CR=1 FL=1